MKDTKELTLWLAWSRLDKTDIGQRAIANAERVCRAWERFTSDPPVGQITEYAVREFEAAALQSGLRSPTVMEYGVQVGVILRRLGIWGRAPRAPKNSESPSAAGMSVREVFQVHYVPTCVDVSSRTIIKIRHELNLWERNSSNPPLVSIKPAHFNEFRKKSLEGSLSASYIEGVVSDVLMLMRHCVANEITPGLVVSRWTAGKRLRRQLRLKPTPSIADLSAAYAKCKLAEWPGIGRWSRVRENGTGRFLWSGHLAAHARLWWECLLTALFCTALRRGDLLRLTWGNVLSDRIRVHMRKTRRGIEIPVHPILAAHLALLPRTDDLVFGHVGSLKQVRQQLKLICKGAGIPLFNLQACRRASAQAWHRAAPGCGTLILGHPFRGSDFYYLDPFQQLQSAVPNLEIPPAMLKPFEAPESIKVKPKKAATKAKAQSGPANGILESLRTMDRDDALKVLQAAVAELSAKGAPA